MTDEERKRKARQLRDLLGEYRGGIFALGCSGGNVGMITFHDRHGQEWFIGSFRGDGERFVAGVNLALELLYRE